MIIPTSLKICFVTSIIFFFLIANFFFFFLFFFISCKLVLAFQSIFSSRSLSIHTLSWYLSTILNCYSCVCVCVCVYIYIYIYTCIAFQLFFSSLISNILGVSRISLCVIVRWHRPCVGNFLPAKNSNLKISQHKLFWLAKLTLWVAKCLGIYSIFYFSISNNSCIRKTNTHFILVLI